MGIINNTAYSSNNKPCAYHNNDCAYSNFISGCKKKKMKAKKWKQLQRTAYVFYGHMYVHIVTYQYSICRLGLGTYIANVVIY